MLLRRVMRVKPSPPAYCCYGVCFGVLSECPLLLVECDLTLGWNNVEMQCKFSCYNASDNYMYNIIIKYIMKYTYNCY